MPSTAGYSGTPLAKKLGVKAGHRVGTVDAPQRFSELVDPLPEGSRLAPVGRAKADYDVIVAFATDETTVLRHFERLPDRLDVDGGLWLSWPKQSSPLATDLKEGAVRAAGLAAGLVDNKICAIDADWSGLRFVFRREDRPAIRAARHPDS